MAINVDDLKFNNSNIIDVRDNYSYNMGHIEGAVNIPYYKLLGNYSRFLNKYEKYYLYCDYGEQSKEISTRLNLFGYNTESIHGGYKEYISKYKNNLF